MRRSTFFLVILAAAAVLVSCERGKEIPTINLDEPEAAAGVNAVKKKQPIRIAISAIVSPSKNIRDYEAMLRYVGVRIGRPIKTVLRSSYAETNALLDRREIDAAFVCSGPYVDGKAKFGAELLVAPVVDGAKTYHSYIIVKKRSPYRRFEDLKGKRFAFTDPLSTTGCLYPKSLLVKRGTTAESFFKETIFTQGHDNSVEAVADGLVDGAAVDHLIWERMLKNGLKKASSTRVILKSPPFGMPPIVVHPSLESDLKENLRRVFLEMHETPAGKGILRRAGVERFVRMKDSDYDTVRKILAVVSSSESPR